MKKAKLIICLLLGTVTVFTACKKEIDHRDPCNPAPNPAPAPAPNPAKPDSLMSIKLKAVISIGNIVYDSIPASITITTWDSSQRAFEKKLVLAPGTNEIKIPKTHVKFRIALAQWGVQDEMTLTKQQLEEAGIISLGGSKAARKLTLEESFIFAAGEYRPKGKTVYIYNSDGTLNRMDFYRKKVEEMELKPSGSHQFFYAGKNISEIKYFDATGKQYGFLKFTYNALGNVENMEQKSYDQQTFAYVQHGYSTGEGEIGIDFLFDNGQAMEYTMKFKGGNKVEDVARTSRGGGEGGKYVYDHNINPYIHMNIPNLYLSNTSKNNMTGSEKGYSGAFPTNEPYKFEYAYDSDGYPKELLKSYQSYEGQHLYHTKTVFTY